MLCLAGFVLNACREEEPYVYKCQDGPVNFELFNDELNPAARLFEEGNLDMRYVVIQSEHDLYSKLFIAYLKKKVDFNTRSLIVIRIKANTRAYVTSQSVTANCLRNKLTINAIMRYGSHPISGIDYVFAIVPKIPTNTSVEFFPTYTY